MTTISLKTRSNMPQWKSIDKDQDSLLLLALGEEKCSNSVWDNFVSYLLVPIVATVILILFIMLPLRTRCVSLCRSNLVGSMLLVIAFFVIIYLVEDWVNKYREEHEVCSQEL